MKINKKCRYCGTDLDNPFLDLGMQPLSNDYLSADRVSKGQHYLPLRVCVCHDCGLVQISDYEMPGEIFNEGYKYFSSYSTSWLKHCEDYVDMITDRLSLDSDSEVYEVASNDGYLLQYFLKYGIKPVGIEPSTSTAVVAVQKGIETLTEYFGVALTRRLVEEGRRADLIIANNVLAHVPDIRDFVSGFKLLLKPQGTVTIESPHFLNILKYNQFDTVYHEHFSYITILAMMRIFSECGLKIYDIEELDTHGGSLRIYATHIDNSRLSVTDNVQRILDKEREYGIEDYSAFDRYSETVKTHKNKILSKLIELKNDGKTIVGYGAAAKGNTLFNYCGIGPEYIDYVVDASPHKQGLYLPGSLIPIYDPECIRETRPDYILIIPWNISKEIISQLSYVSEWECRFMTFIPDIEEFDAIG